MILCQKVIIIVGILLCLSEAVLLEGISSSITTDSEDIPDRCIKSTSIVEQLDIDVDEPNEISIIYFSERYAGSRSFPRLVQVKEEETEASAEEEETPTATIEEEEETKSKIEETTSFTSAAAVEEKTEPKIEETTPPASADLRYMSAIIYAEAANQCLAGQQAVGIVVQNRSDSSAFDDGIYNVIYQKGQFAPVRNGMLDQALAAYDDGSIPASCIEAAKYALNGNKTVTYNNATIDLTGIYYFSVKLDGAKFTIQSHQFK